jgi:hypothetical protein
VPFHCDEIFKRVVDIRAKKTMVEQECIYCPKIDDARCPTFEKIQNQRRLPLGVALTQVIHVRAYITTSRNSSASTCHCVRGQGWGKAFENLQKPRTETSLSPPTGAHESTERERESARAGAGAGGRELLSVVRGAWDG